VRRFSQVAVSHTSEYCDYHSVGHKRQKATIAAQCRLLIGIATVESSWISKALNRTTGDSNHAQAKTQMNPPLEPKSKLKFFTFSC